MKPRRVALLIDGNNVSALHAQDLFALARTHGEVVFSRAYVNAGVGNGDWVATGLVDVLVTGLGGNVSDFRLSFEAVEMDVKGGYDVFVIASNDLDLVHVVRWLTEKGRTVVVAGTQMMGKVLRKSTDVVCVLPKKSGKVSSAPKTSDADAMLTLIKSVLSSNGNRMPMTTFGHDMVRLHGVNARKAGHKTWSKYFAGHPDMFRISGPDMASVLSRVEEDASCPCAESSDAPKNP